MYVNVIYYAVLAMASTLFFAQANPLAFTPNVGSYLYPGINPCQQGATPILYQDYYADQCPPALSLNPDGPYPVSGGTFTNCDAYCEVKLTFTYDEEKPVLNNPYCHGPLLARPQKVKPSHTHISSTSMQRGRRQSPQALREASAMQTLQHNFNRRQWILQPENAATSLFATAA